MKSGFILKFYWLDVFIQLYDLCSAIVECSEIKENIMKVLCFQSLLKVTGNYVQYKTNAHAQQTI
jgi:hypothetical protein